MIISRPGAPVQWGTWLLGAIHNVPSCLVTDFVQNLAFILHLGTHAMIKGVRFSIIMFNVWMRHVCTLRCYRGMELEESFPVFIVTCQRHLSNCVSWSLSYHLIKTHVVDDEFPLKLIYYFRNVSKYDNLWATYRIWSNDSRLHYDFSEV